MEKNAQNTKDDVRFVMKTVKEKFQAVMRKMPLPVQAVTLGLLVMNSAVFFDQVNRTKQLIEGGHDLGQPVYFESLNGGGSQKEGREPTAKGLNIFTRLIMDPGIVAGRTVTALVLKDDFSADDVKKTSFVYSAIKDSFRM